MNSERGTLIIAIVLALFLWTSVRMSREVPDSQRILRGVPISVVEKPNANLSYDLTSGDHVDISVKGPDRYIYTLNSEQVKAQVDLSVIRSSGQYKMPVSIQGLPRTVKLDGRAPEVTVTFVELEQQSFPVTIGFIKQPPAGTTVGEYLVQPSTVTIEGTKDALSRVKYVTVAVDPTVPMRSETGVIPHAVDGAGELVKEASILSVSTIKVRMASLTGEHVTRMVAVRQPELKNLPRRYSISVAKVRPDEVTLSGDSALLGAQPAYLETDPIDVRHVSKDTTVTVRLRVPRGLTVVEGPEVRVDLEVHPME